MVREASRLGIWRIVSGEVDSDEFVEQTASDDTNGIPFVRRRWFVEDDQLIVSDGKTFAFTNRWGRGTEPALQALIAEFPRRDVSYERADGASM